MTKRKIIQREGPFSANQSIEFNKITGWKYVHLGIQYPDALPLHLDLQTKPGLDNIEKITNMFDEKEKPKFYQTGVNDYNVTNADFIIRRGTDTTPIARLKINAKNILEFDDLSEGNFEIVCMRDMPPETLIEATIQYIEF